MKRLLIANRGEIASRIARTAKKRGITTIGIAAFVDRNLPFTHDVDELFLLEGTTATETYLNQSAILNIIKKAEADALHPGYGFLSENPHFAQKLEESGVVFVGPRPETIALLGSKTDSKTLAKRLNVSIAHGTEGGLSDETLISLAQNIGFPLMIKAKAGGGGRGMRVAFKPEELSSKLKEARSEGKKFFSDDDVFLETYIENPRHVEVQFFGDGEGKILLVGTRDCSLQRRHQKLIEEAPAQVSAILEEKILDATKKIAAEVKYRNAGTAEFLVTGDAFYFLEVNTRLQVEHPVSEAITDMDFVDLQLSLAEGEPIPDQKTITFQGHAIEFRINAEDVENDFTPASGKIEKLSFFDPETRFDVGYASGTEVPAVFDNLIGKLIVKGDSREEAIHKGLVALFHLSIEGIPTTKSFYRFLGFCTDWRKSQKTLNFLPSLIKDNQESLRKFLAEDKKPRYESIRTEKSLSLTITKEDAGTFRGEYKNEKVRALSEQTLERYFLKGNTSL